MKYLLAAFCFTATVTAFVSADFGDSGAKISATAPVASSSSASTGSVRRIIVSAWADRNVQLYLSLIFSTFFGIATYIYFFLYRRFSGMLPAITSTHQLHAFMRYVGSTEEDERLRCRDHLAVMYIPALLRDYVESSWGLFGLSRWMINYVLSSELPGFYELVVARTHWFDQEFQTYLQLNHLRGQDGQSVKQVVVLGSGYDTRLLRFKELIISNNIEAFEVDKAEVLKMNRGILEKNEWSMKHIRSVPCDLAKDDLETELVKNGFKTDLPTLFMFEGVASFLPDARVNRILSFIGHAAGMGSVVCMDYVKLAADQKRFGHVGYMEFRRFIEARGDTIQFFGNSPGIGMFLREHNAGMLKGMHKNRLQQLLWRVDGKHSGSVAPYIDCISFQVGYLPKLNQRKLVPRTGDHETNNQGGSQHDS